VKQLDPAGSNSSSPAGVSLTGAIELGSSSASFDLGSVPDKPGLLFAGSTTVNQSFGCGRRCV
jgi:hypothetical protein